MRREALFKQKLDLYMMIDFDIFRAMFCIYGFHDIKINSKENNFFNTVNINVINRKMQIKFFLILFCFE